MRWILSLPLASEKSTSFLFYGKILDMPELPEVQTIVDDLKKKVVGKTIVDFWSDYKKAVRPSFVGFKRGVKNKKIIGVERRGKHLILNLEHACRQAGGGYSIVIHLKMIGHLLFKPKKLSNRVTQFFDERVNGYIHHIIYFKGGGSLAMSDMRKFAWLALVKTKDVEKMKEVALLGIDALSVDLSLKRFETLLEKRRKSKIGVVILDQKWIAGVGNIYRSEILFEAGIAPERVIGSLKISERKKLYQTMRKVLKKAVRMRGTSTVDYRDTDGKKGNFQNALRVYGREGEKCLKCNGRIKRVKLGQRSAFVCKKCQK